MTIDHRHPRLGELAHDREHLADELGVERRRRLVEEHHLGVEAQRARDRDALLLAARQLARDSGRPSGADPRAAARGRRRSSASARPTRFAERSGSEMLSSAVRCGKRLNCWNTIPTWRRRASALPRRSLRAEPRAVLDAEHAHRACARLLEHVDRPQQRRLARARRPEDDDVLALVHGQVDAVQDLVGSERLPDPLQADDDLRPNPGRAVLLRRGCVTGLRHRRGECPHSGRTSG